MRQIFRSINDGWQFYRQNGFKTALTSKQAPWIIQFGKYGACGVAAVVTHSAIAYLLNYTGIPWRGAPAEGLTPLEMSKNQEIANLIAFPFGNFVAYFSNLLIVFTGGRHSRWREFLYFTLISFVSWYAGVLAGPKLVRYGLNPDVAQLFFILSSALVNYICRKFFVFKH